MRVSRKQKGTAYAAQIAAEKAAEIAKRQYGLASVDAFVKGVGLGRDAAIRSMQNFDIRVDSIKRRYRRPSAAYDLKGRGA